MKKLLLPALLSVLLAACGSVPVQDDASTTADSPIPPVTPSPPLDGESLTDPNSILSKRSVYFDFDRYDIRPEFRPLVEAHARFLVRHPERHIMIQGNTDERGSREYNLALGQKRADAVRRALTLLGARDSQIEAVSLGEEKPRCTEASESCYAENRRGDIRYKGEF
jgi:peptidoglycan-associated lipoprotein